MLDKKDGNLKLILDILDPENHVLLFFRIHTGAGFIQEKKIRFQGQCPSKLNELLGSIGKRAHKGIPHILEFKKIDNIFNFFTVKDFLFSGKRRFPPHGYSLKKPCFHMDMTTQHDIFHGVHMGKQFNILESPGNAHPGNGIGLFMLYGSAFENHIPFTRLIKPGYAVEKGGLSRTIGTDNGKDLTLVHGKTDIFQGFDAAKRNGQGIHPEKSRFHTI